MPKAKIGDLIEISSPTHRPSVVSKAIPLYERTTKQTTLSSGVHIYGSESVKKGAECAKNAWVWTGCHWDLNICTYNALSLSSDDRMIELEEEILRIKWNIIGLSEVHRKGKGSIILNNTGHTVYYSGSHEQRHGVGFVVNKNIVHNVISFRGLSDGVAKLTVRINKRYQLKCVQVYLVLLTHN